MQEDYVHFMIVVENEHSIYNVINEFNTFANMS